MLGWALISLKEVRFGHEEHVSVSSKDKLPIPGATVYVENSSVSNSTNQKSVIESASIGTITDFDGNFKINVQKNVGVLVFSYLGFKTKEVSYSDTQKLTVALTEEV